ncbi:MAG: hypothetical protein KME64_09780 [Scytonematopsis contorta HA4267-MV1]|nr:hypothetical protein [Scytonematopsis contorta HA4267-MV1]
MQYKSSQRINAQPSTVTSQPSPVNRQQSPITNYQLPVTNYQLPITIENHEISMGMFVKKLRCLGRFL